MHIAAILPAVLPLALAATHNVDVGKQGLFYSPNTLNPAVNDTVVFTFYNNIHSVAQSTFDKPCVLVENGIFSGFPGKVRLSRIGLSLVCRARRACNNCSWRG